MLPPLMRLTEEEQRFVADFVMCSGSLKEMAARMGVSYPSVRNRLDEIIGELRRAVAADMSDETVGMNEYAWCRSLQRRNHDKQANK